MRIGPDPHSLSDLHGWDRVQGVVEPRCSCRDAVFSLRWGAISPRGAGPTRLGRMDAARREGRCWPRAIWCQRTPRVRQPRDRVRVRHTLDENLAHGHARGAAKCACDTPIDGAGVSAASTPPALTRQSRETGLAPLSGLQRDQTRPSTAPNPSLNPARGEVGHKGAVVG